MDEGVVVQLPDTQVLVGAGWTGQLDRLFGLEVRRDRDTGAKVVDVVLAEGSDRGQDLCAAFNVASSSKAMIVLNVSVKVAIVSKTLVAILALERLFQGRLLACPRSRLFAIDGVCAFFDLDQAGRHVLFVLFLALLSLGFGVGRLDMNSLDMVGQEVKMSERSLAVGADELVHGGRDLLGVLAGDGAGQDDLAPGVPVTQYHGGVDPGKLLDGNVELLLTPTLNFVQSFELASHHVEKNSTVSSSDLVFGHLSLREVVRSGNRPGRIVECDGDHLEQNICLKFREKSKNLAYPRFCAVFLPGLRGWHAALADDPGAVDVLDVDAELVRPEPVRVEAFHVVLKDVDDDVTERQVQHSHHGGEIADLLDSSQIGVGSLLIQQKLIGKTVSLPSECCVVMFDAVQTPRADLTEPAADHGLVQVLAQDGRQDVHVALAVLRQIGRNARVLVQVVVI